jgi:hypothetical protein
MAPTETDRARQSLRTRTYAARFRLGSVAVALALGAACSNQANVADTNGGLTGAGAALGQGGTGGGAGMAANGGTGDSSNQNGGTGAMGGSSVIMLDGGVTQPEKCDPTTCAEQGYACGAIVDACGKVIHFADEGLTCGPLEACVGGVDAPAKCMTNSAEPCDLCGAVPDCSNAAQKTTLTGRVITPGRDDANMNNQVGVPNAFVYILRNKGTDDLPAIGAGIPEGKTSCDRCDEQDLGPVLVGTVTDATGAFTLEGNVPVGEEFTLVIKAGRFRRAVPYTLPDSAACQTTTLPATLPDNPARLPRNMKDGLAVNIPHIAVSTGSIDAMECVLEKMGISHDEFTNPGTAGDGAGRIHIYRGRSHDGGGRGNGVSIDANTPLEDKLYADPKRLDSYDIVLADCEGQYADDTAGTSMNPMGGGGRGGMMGGRAGAGTGTAGTGTAAGGAPGAGGTPGAADIGSAAFAERDAWGANVIDYVNRGGRMFASHLRYSWLYQNGTKAYDANDPLHTGLAAAAAWEMAPKNTIDTGTGVVSVNRPQASPRIQAFADWMNNEKVALAPNYGFDIEQPRSQVDMLGASSEEFVYTSSVTTSSMMTTTADKVQQFSFNTPYAAPADAACGRIAYSGFHVTVGDTTNATFPAVCTGDLTKQEKVLLYMLFDLATCVGNPPPPPACEPTTCEKLGVECGFSGDGCGQVLDCGPCQLPPPK